MACVHAFAVTTAIIRNPRRISPAFADSPQAQRTSLLARLRQLANARQSPRLAAGLSALLLASARGAGRDARNILATSSVLPDRVGRRLWSGPERFPAQPRRPRPF